MTELAPRFSYESLPKELADAVRTAADQIRAHGQTAIASVVEIGHVLILTKSHLKHGNFLTWLNAEFGWSERTAQNYMQVALEFADKPEIIADLTLTTVYALAAPATPPSVRQAVVERRLAGEELPEPVIKDMIADGRRQLAEGKRTARITPEERAKRAARDKRRQKELEKHRRDSDELQERVRAARTAAAAMVVTWAGKHLPELLAMMDEPACSYISKSDLVEASRAGGEV